MNTISNDPISTARRALACLDLTRLDDADTEADIERLCQRASSPFGPVAAVCVWPRLAAFARGQLPPAIRVAAVANFPQGDAEPERALRDIAAIAEAGDEGTNALMSDYIRAQEKLVWMYSAFLNKAI